MVLLVLLSAVSILVSVDFLLFLSPIPISGKLLLQ